MHSHLQVRIRCALGAAACIAGLTTLEPGHAWAEEEGRPPGPAPADIPLAPVGSIGWIEFAADRESGNAFFSQVFGWSFEPYMDGYDIYYPPAGVGGGYRNAGESDVPVLPFIVVADIDAVIATLKAEGAGVLLEKEPVGDGSIAVVTDCSGNPLGLTDLTTPLDYHPDPFGDPALLVHGALCSIEIYGGDLPACAEYFARHFGWVAEEPAGAYMGFDPQAGLAGVFQSHTPEEPYVPYIWVEDVDPVLELVAANGGEVLGEPGREEGSPVFAYFMDPGGIMFGLMAPEGT